MALCGGGQGFKVFIDNFSQPCRAVLLLLHANKVPYEPVMINVAQGIVCSWVLEHRDGVTLFDDITQVTPQVERTYMKPIQVS